MRRRTDGPQILPFSLFVCQSSDNHVSPNFRCHGERILNPGSGTCRHLFQAAAEDSLSLYDEYLEANIRLVDYCSSFFENTVDYCSFLFIFSVIYY